MQFRLAILKYAFTLFENSSFLYGSALSGSQTVPLALLPGWEWWWHVKVAGEATIHSDFVVVLVLTGMLGYTVFSFAFYLVLKDRFRELARRDLRGDAVVLQAISIIGLIALIIYCSDQPCLSYYNHAHSVWMLLLISEVARKSRVIGSAESVGKRAFRPLHGWPAPPIRSLRKGSDNDEGGFRNHLQIIRCARLVWINV